MLLTAAYATRVWLLAFRGAGPPVPAEESGREPVVMNIVLWVLALPSIGLGLAYGFLPKWFDSDSLAPSPTTSVLATGVALIGVLVMYGAWRHSTPSPPPATHGRRRRAPAERPRAIRGGGDRHPRTRLRRHRRSTRPGRPRPAAAGPAAPRRRTGFRLDAAYSALFVGPTRAAARLVRFLDRDRRRDLRTGRGRRTRLLGISCAVPRPATCRPTSALCSWLLVLAVVLVAAGTGGN